MQKTFPGSCAKAFSSLIFSSKTIIKTYYFNYTISQSHVAEKEQIPNKSICLHTWRGRGAEKKRKYAHELIGYKSLDPFICLIRSFPLWSASDWGWRTEKRSRI